MLTVLTPALRTVLHDALYDARCNAYDHETIFARSADLRALFATPDYTPLTGALRDAAAYYAFIDA